MTYVQTNKQVIFDTFDIVGIKKLQTMNFLPSWSHAMIYIVNSCIRRLTGVQNNISITTRQIVCLG